MFLLKKFLSVWVMPLPFSLTLLVIGLWLIRSSKRRNRGRFFLACGVLSLLVFSNRFVSNRLIFSLEQTYPAIAEFPVVGPILPPELRDCKYVVVLGGGHVDAPHLAALDKLSVSSRARLAQGVRLLRVLPEAKLIVSGPGASNQPSHAAVQADAAISLGVASDRIIRIEAARDTEEEAGAVSTLVGPDAFVLVTSAWHLPRAMALMQRKGLNPLPCPCDYMGRTGETRMWTDYLWDTESLGRSTRAIYERLGYFWSAVRGKI